MKVKSLEHEIIDIVRKIYNKKNVELHPPYLDKKDVKLVKNSITKNEISTYGSITEKFESCC